MEMNNISNLLSCDIDPNKSAVIGIALICFTAIVITLIVFGFKETAHKRNITHDEEEKSSNREWAEKHIPKQHLNVILNSSVSVSQQPQSEQESKVEDHSPAEIQNTVK